MKRIFKMGEAAIEYDCGSPTITNRYYPSKGLKKLLELSMDDGNIKGRVPGALIDPKLFEEDNIFTWKWINKKSKPLSSALIESLFYDQNRQLAAQRSAAGGLLSNAAGILCAPNNFGASAFSVGSARKRALERVPFEENRIIQLPLPCFEDEFYRSVPPLASSWVPIKPEDGVNDPSATLKAIMFLVVIVLMLGLAGLSIYYYFSQT